MKTKTSLLLILLLGVNYLTNAQTIRGKITDSESSALLEGANIMVSPGNSGYTSKSDGTFIIEGVKINTKYLLNVSFIGYETQTVSIIPVSEETIINIHLKPEQIHLTEVTIEDELQGEETNGYRYSSSELGNLGSFEIKKIPFSVHQTSGELLSNMQARDLSSALSTNPAVVVTKTGNSDERGLSNTQIRGLTPSYILDGLPVNSYHIPHPEMLDRIDVIQGATGFFYGFSGANGIISLHSKKAPENFSGHISSGFHNGMVRFMSASAGTSVNKKKTIKIMGEVFSENGGTTIKGQEQERRLFSLRSDIALAPETQLSVSSYYQESDIFGQQCIFALNPSAGVEVPDPSDFDLTRLYGQTWTSSINDYFQTAVHFNSEINEHISVRVAYKIATGKWKYDYFTASLTDNSGNYTLTYTDYSPQDRLYQSGYAFADINFRTGDVKHRVSAGYSGDYTGIRFGGSLRYSLPEQNISNPVNIYLPDSILTATGHLESTNHNQYFYHNIILGDYIEITPWLTVFGGANLALYQTSRTTGNLTQSGAAEYTQHRVSPSLSVSLSPTNYLNVYASYIEGLKLGGTAPAGSENEQEMLNPSPVRQVELGTKWNVGKLNINLAAFNINLANEYVDPGDNVYKQDGRQTHMGTELMLGGMVHKNIMLSGGLTLMNVTVTKAENNTELEGKTPRDVPETQAKLYAEFRLPWISGLSLYGNAIYTGERPVDALNLAYMPETILFNCGLRYKFTTATKQDMSFNLKINNLANTSYYTAYFSNGLRLGTVRNVSLSLRFDF